MRLIKVISTYIFAKDQKQLKGFGYRLYLSFNFRKVSCI
jgi:hypothetical protein